MSFEQDDKKNVCLKVAEELATAQRVLYVYIFSMVPSREDVDDLLQNTNNTILRKSKTAENVSNFLAWAKQVAYFEILAWKKNRARDRHLFLNEVVLEQPSDTHTDIHQNSMELAALDKCKNDLKLNEQKLLSLRYEQGIRASEIASSTGQKENTIRQQLFRIRNRLLKCIRNRISFQGELE